MLNGWASCFNFNAPSLFRARIRGFKEIDAEYHTYQPKDDRAFRAVIRNIDPYTPEYVVLGFHVRSVLNLKQKGTKEPLRLTTLKNIYSYLRTWIIVTSV